MLNPLLQYAAQNTVLPPFSAIKPKHVEPALEALLTENQQKIDALATQADITWKSFIEPLENLTDKLQRLWSPVSHMNSVVNSDDLRKAYNNCLSKLSGYHTELGQNTNLFTAYKSIAEGPIYKSLSTSQKTVIDHAMRDFRLSGIDLANDKKDRFKEVSKTLSTLSAKFSDNVLDATQAWTKHITDIAVLSGLPESALSLAEQTAMQKEKTGWVITLDFPSYHAVMSYADSRELRKEVHDAFVTRASNEGPHADKWDNSNLMEEILSLRHEKAQLLGFANYAEYSLATKMATNTAKVVDFLLDLAKRTKSLAKDELHEISEFAKQKDGLDKIEPWDAGYYGEKLRQHKYAITQEEIKPYFPEDNVVNGLFEVVNKLYGLTITEVNEIDTWHADVRFFEIRDSNNTLRGKFYLDLYARPNKRGGAWMDDCVCRRKVNNEIQIPVAYLTCNFSPPVGDKPALFTHQEVNTLFHEFGHGLHHMLTQIDELDVSGINGVPWDAVELPSQFMENWCWDKTALNLLARHYKTDQQLPDELYNKMIAAKNFQSGMQMLRQLEFALFDFRIHLEYAPENGAKIQSILDEVRQQVAVLNSADYNRFQHSFSHIFAGGYAAGYYSYKWAEVLSADAFSKFEETGVFNRSTGTAFLTQVLEKGGSQEPMALFIAFRGREPNIDALLRHSGITP